MSSRPTRAPTHVASRNLRVDGLEPMTLQRFWNRFLKQGGGLHKDCCVVIDECSQVDNALALEIDYALRELPHDPFIAVAADYKQLQPVSSSWVMARICGNDTTITLSTIHRTDDEELLTFLTKVRESQPERDELYRFFRCFQHVA